MSVIYIYLRVYFKGYEYGMSKEYNFPYETKIKSAYLSICSRYMMILRINKLNQ